jgi:hypothetical protein
MGTRRGCLRSARDESVPGLVQCEVEKAQDEDGYRSTPSTAYSCPGQRFFGVPL